MDCVLVTRMSCVKVAELIEMLFGELTHIGPRNHVLDGVKIGQIHLQPQRVTSLDAAFCQITLDTCHYPYRACLLCHWSPQWDLVAAASKPHHEIQAVLQLHSRGTSVCLWNVDTNESGLDETGILSSALSKKDSRHQVVWLHYECWGLHQIRSTEYPMVRRRRLSLFGHVALMPDNVPAKAVLRVACVVCDGVPPFPNWRRPLGRPGCTRFVQTAACELETPSTVPRIGLCGERTIRPFRPCIHDDDDLLLSSLSSAKPSWKQRVGKIRKERLIIFVGKLKWDVMRLVDTWSKNFDERSHRRGADFSRGTM